MCEVERLREWTATVAADQRRGEWECGYTGWTELYTAWNDFLGAFPPSTWTEAETEGAIYALARDNEVEHLSKSLARLPACEIVHAARVTERVGEPDARWQIAAALGKVADHAEERSCVEPYLLKLAADPEEYVRRRALESLVRIRSGQAERLALTAWNEAPEDMPWSRMMALWALKQTQSRSFDPLLREAMASANRDMTGCCGSA